MKKILLAIPFLIISNIAFAQIGGGNTGNKPADQNAPKKCVDGTTVPANGNCPDCLDTTLIPIPAKPTNIDAIIKSWIKPTQPTQPEKITPSPARQGIAPPVIIRPTANIFEAFWNFITHKRGR